MKGIARDVAGSFMQVSCGSFHTCALRTDGTIHCWGKNNVGQIDAPSGSGFVQVSCGREHSCALKEDGEAICWGGKTWGETAVPKGHQFLQISSGAWHSTCAVDLDGTVRCWGANGYGQASMGKLPFAPQTHVAARYKCGGPRRSDQNGCKTAFTSPTHLFMHRSTWRRICSGLCRAQVCLRDSQKRVRNVLGTELRREGRGCSQGRNFHADYCRLPACLRGCGVGQGAVLGQLYRWPVLGS